MNDQQLTREKTYSFGPTLKAYGYEAELSRGNELVRITPQLLPG